MDRFEYHCPVHGIVMWHFRSEADPPVRPRTCPYRGEDDLDRCGREVVFKLVAMARSTREARPASEPERRSSRTG
jgi:hypothetical protein